MKKTLFILIFAIAALSVFVSCNNNAEVVTYKVTVKNGEEVYKERNIADGDIYVLPSKPADSRPFKGWKVGESTELMQPGEDLTITADTEITAVWVTSCTVSFDLGDSTLTEIEDVSVEYGTAISFSPTVPDRTGYAFDGWYLNEEKYILGTTLVTEDITLKAHWTTKYCTVSFDTDGGAALSSLKIPYGEKINIAGTPADPTRTGYTFVKWTLEDGTDFSYDNVIESDTKLKAQWQIKSCTVSFDLGDSTLAKIDDMTVDYGTVKAAPEVPHRTGYVFSAWKIRNGGVFDFANPITEDLELEAVWTQIKTNLTVYFPKNVNDVETIKVDVGGSVVTIPYSGGEEDGEYGKYTADVTGLDLGTYTATVTTLRGNSVVGGSFSDTMKVSYVESDEEIRVDTSNVVDITTSVTAQASSVSGDSSNGYVISGTATLNYGDGVTVLYSIDGSEPSVAYTSGTSLDVTSSTSLALKVSPTDSSKWATGTVSNEISFESLLGSTGPGGGIIFYDAGSVKYYPSEDNASYSYRFLEAATKDLDGTYQFSSSTTDVYSTSHVIGSGKANTELLKGISGSAAEACSKYTQGEKSDWFLPSRDELKALLGKSQIVKGLSSSWYWSSSIDFSETSRALLNSISDRTMYVTMPRDGTYNVRPIRCF